MLGRQLSRNTGSFNGSSVGTGGSSADGSGGWSGGGLGVRSQQQLSGVQLAVLGAGSLLGENVLGYNPEEVSLLLGFRQPTLLQCCWCHLKKLSMQEHMVIRESPASVST